MSVPTREPIRKGRPKSRERMLQLPVGYLVLLALAKGPSYGAELVSRIVGDTMGRYVGGRSLYDEIRRLEESGLLERREAGQHNMLELTEEGERALKFSTRELKLVLDVAKQRKLC